MIFIAFFDYPGTHVPALGAFVVSLVVVAVVCLCFYKLGVRAANIRWRWDVEHMPEVIGQDIRERLEREKVKLEARVNWQADRLRVLEPLSSGIVDLVRRSTESK